MELTSGTIGTFFVLFAVLNTLSLAAGANEKEAFVFGDGAGQLSEHGNRGIHCSVLSSQIIPIIDIDGIIRTELSILFEDPRYATPTSYLKCYIPLPLRIGTTSSLNGSTLQVDYGSIPDKFSVLLLYIPDDDKGKFCDSEESSGSGHGVGVGLQERMATDPDLHFDTESKPVTVINNTGDDGIYFHCFMPSPTENSVDVYVNGVSVHRNPYFLLYCSQGINIECFLYFKDVSNIDNGTMIEITVGNSDGGVANAINAIHTRIIKPQGAPCPWSASKTIHSILVLKTITTAFLTIFVFYIAAS